MEGFIRSSVLTIEQVYGGRWRLELPWFQRAYAWSEMHVGRLIKDLTEAMDSPRRRYSLGHMSLATTGPGPTASIIDGHQRSISLTMLFALLRDLLHQGAMADRLHGMIAEPGTDTGTGSDTFRLRPQPGVVEFFATYVQARGAALIEPDGDIMDRSSNERNILANRDHMRSMLGDVAPMPGDLEALAAFLLERCVVVVDEVDDEEEARALMAREEETGLSPHSSELAKVTIVTAMPREEQDRAGRLFQRAQSMLSADDMTSLLGHIRVLKTRRRSSSKPVDAELIQRFHLQSNGLPFLEGELLPRAATLARLLTGNIGQGAARERTARALETLGWLDHQMWVPPALLWLEHRGADHPETPLFAARLDRLAYLLKIASLDPTDQEQRFIDILPSIEAGEAVDSMKPLAIERKLLAAALENLRSRTFYAKRFHALVLRRISCILAPDRDPGPVDGKRVTVEHVLPRKPSADRQWRKDFHTPQCVADYCNRLGNLAFLSIEENNLAANSDFIVKRYLLAQAASRFVLCEHASREEEWTASTIVRRTEMLIGILLEPWGLSP